MFDSLNPLLNTEKLMLDGANSESIQKLQEITLDDVALNSSIHSMRAFALFVVLQLADDIVENDLDENELPTDRLNSLIAGFSAKSEDDEGELEFDESTFDIFVATLKDAWETLGVDENTIELIFGDDSEAEDAVESACEIVVSNAPQGDEFDEFSDLFIYGEAEEDEGVMVDGISVGKTTTKSTKFGRVVYKSVKAIRDGKVKVVNKRVSGRVKLSAKQRNALNKARRKANTGTAIKRRVRSVKKGKQLGI